MLQHCLPGSIERRPLLLAELGTGDVIGDYELLFQMKHAYDHTARVLTDALALSQEDFLHVKEHFELRPLLAFILDH